MSKVWKFKLTKPVQNQVVVELPLGAEILRVEGPEILAVVDPTAPKGPVTFTVVRTDEEFASAGLRYLGTYGRRVEGEPAGEDTDGEGGGKQKWRYFHVFCPETKPNGKAKK